MANEMNKRLTYQSVYSTLYSCLKSLHLKNFFNNLGLQYVSIRLSSQTANNYRFLGKSFLPKENLSLSNGSYAFDGSKEDSKNPRSLSFPCLSANSSNFMDATQLLKFT